MQRETAILRWGWKQEKDVGEGQEEHGMEGKGARDMQSGRVTMTALLCMMVPHIGRAEDSN